MQTHRARRAVVLLHVADRDDLVWITPLVQRQKVEAYANAEVFELPCLTWYQATRHTYGRRFVSSGGSLERLRVILGHSSTEVTLRYGHLVPLALRFAHP